MSTVTVKNGRTNKDNHVSIVGFVQTGIYRFSTCDISEESFIIRKWQKRVPRGPLAIGGWIKKYPKTIFFLKNGKNHTKGKNSEMFRNMTKLAIRPSTRGL